MLNPLNSQAMSSEETSFMIMLLGVVIVFGVVIISMSVVIRKRRMKVIHEGPGNPETPAPTQPWRRFTGALAAPYARPEWHRVRDAKRLYSADQVYFGFVSALPPHTVSSALRTDWGVKNSAQAQEELDKGCQAVVGHAASVIALRGLPADFVETLNNAGAPRAAIERFVDKVRVRGEGNELFADSSGLAFDIARVANLARWSGYVGLIDATRGGGHLDDLGISAAVVFSGWDDFGESYLHGLSTRFKGGSKPYVEGVDWLRTAAASPWQTQPWITAPY